MFSNLHSACGAAKFECVKKERSRRAEPRVGFEFVFINRP